MSGPKGLLHCVDAFFVAMPTLLGVLGAESACAY